MKTFPTFLCLAAVCLGLANTGARAATITVTSTADSGAGSLRQALANANAGDVIEFDLTLPATITLNGEPLSVDPGDVVEILGPGADQLTVSGDGLSTVFDIAFSATAMISGLTISDGDGTLAGGVNVAGELTLRDSTVSNNAGDNAGGINVNTPGMLRVEDSRITANSGGRGGGIRNATGTLILVRSTVDGNSASGFFGEGGGIYSSPGTQLSMIINSTVSGNTSAEDGAGIWHGGDNSLALFNTTVAGNSAGGDGDGIYNETSSPKNGLTIWNSIVADNIGDECHNASGFFVAQGTNFATDGTCPDFTQVTSAALGLGALQDNGGPTETHALSADSVALDTVASSDCLDAAGDPLGADQRGEARPADSDGDDVADCDPGAFELAFASLLVTPPRLEFGDHPLGVPSDPLMVVLENVGPGGAQLGTPALEGAAPADYAITTDTCSGQTLMPGDFCGVEVTFTAAGAGVREARLRILSNAPETPHFIELTGSHDVLLADGFED